MSMMKRHMEDLAYEYLKSHLDLEIDEIFEKIANGEIQDDDETANGEIQDDDETE